MNVCNFINKIYLMFNYTIYGEIETAVCETEISLAEAIFTVLIGVIWGTLAAWWLAPIQFLVNKLHLRNIKFKCNR